LAQHVEQFEFTHMTLEVDQRYTQPLVKEEYRRRSKQLLPKGDTTLVAKMMCVEMHINKTLSQPEDRKGVNRNILLK
jgi:hypothetical protein